MGPHHQSCFLVSFLLITENHRGDDQAVTPYRDVAPILSVTPIGVPQHHTLQSHYWSSIVHSLNLNLILCLLTNQLHLLEVWFLLHRWIH